MSGGTTKHWAKDKRRSPPEQLRSRGPNPRRDLPLFWCSRLLRIISTDCAGMGCMHLLGKNTVAQVTKK
eukprot:4700019-Karenia_brevis.AAC.1